MICWNCKLLLSNWLLHRCVFYALRGCVSLDHLLLYRIIRQPIEEVSHDQRPECMSNGRIRVETVRTTTELCTFLKIVSIVRNTNKLGALRAKFLLLHYSKYHLMPNLMIWFLLFSSIVVRCSAIGRESKALSSQSSITILSFLSPAPPNHDLFTVLETLH